MPHARNWIVNPLTGEVKPGFYAIRLVARGAEHALMVEVATDNFYTCRMNESPLGPSSPDLAAAFGKISVEDGLAGRPITTQDYFSISAARINDLYAGRGQNPVLADMPPIF